MGHKKAESIETLFQLYDMLEAHCQQTAKAGRTASGRDAAAAAQLLDELRQRFVRLVSTWHLLCPASGCSIFDQTSNLLGKGCLP